MELWIEKKNYLILCNGYWSVLDFLLFSAILVHRWLPGSRNLKKLVHLGLQGVALACGIFGIWTRFHGKDGFVANFYSLHSWMGLFCIFLFASQVHFQLFSFPISFVELFSVFPLLFYLFFFSNSENYSLFFFPLRNCIN